MDKDMIQIKDGVVYFNATDTVLTLSGVESVVKNLESALRQNSQSVLVVNQLKLNNIPSSIEDKAWIELYRALPPYAQKTATLCPSIVNKLQANYVFQKEGVSDRFKAFVAEDATEICTFLGVEHILLDK